MPDSNQHSELVEKIRLEFRPHQTVDAGYYDDRAYIQCTEHVPEGCYRCDLDAALDGLLEQLDSEQRLREAAEQQYAAAEVQYGTLKEQNETLRDILRGFLYDADMGDLPGIGQRDKARAVLFPATRPEGSDGGQ